MNRGEEAEQRLKTRVSPAFAGRMLPVNRQVVPAALSIDLSASKAGLSQTRQRPEAFGEVRGRASTLLAWPVTLQGRWHQTCPARAICTAERAAFSNRPLSLSVVTRPKPILSMRAA